MAARASIGAFSFPSARGCVSPSKLAMQLAFLTRVTSVLAGALTVSLFATMWLANVAAKRADVIPYVADGGVFGCEVRVIAPPARAVNGMAGTDS